MPYLTNGVAGSPVSAKAPMFGSVPPGQATPAAKGARGAVADDADFARGQEGQDFDQNRQQFMSLLDGLKTAGYAGRGGGSSSSESAGGGAGGGVMAPWTPTTGGAGSPVAPIAPVDTSAATSAAFARAKDKVGQTASGALAGLRSSLGGRGMLGSGVEARGTASVINRGQGELGDVARSQAVDEAKLASEAATVNFQGGITQRGQDLAAAGDRDRLSLTARGQDMNAAESRANRAAAAATHEDDNLASIMGLWRSFRGGGGRAAY